MSANSDEHRGRCGGSAPGTTVFGTKGGLTGVLAERLVWKSVAEAIRACRTFATTGQRLVGLVSAGDTTVQDDNLAVSIGETVALKYHSSEGFCSVEAWDASGWIFRHNLQQEPSADAPASTQRKLRVKWGGAGLYDLYREAVWQGSVIVNGASISSIRPFGGVLDNSEEKIELATDTQVTFDMHKSGEFDGVDLFFAEDCPSPSSVSVTGQLGGYLKVGNAMDGNLYKVQPSFSLVASGEETN